MDAFKECFEKTLPIEIFGTLKKKVEQLVIKDDTLNEKALITGSVDVDKFLEYCTNVF